MSLQPDLTHPRPALFDPLAGSAPLGWLMTAGALLALSWEALWGAPMPMPGLRALAEPASGGPVAAVSLAMAAFLSLPRLLTRDRLLVCAGVALAVFGAMALYVSPVAGIPFVFITGNLLRSR